MARARSRDPDTSYHVHFIFGVTSYQREKLCSLHPITTSYRNHFILRVVSYHESLHTKSHFIPEVTSYQSHFIPKSLHTSHRIPISSYQSLHIEFYFIPKSLHNSHSMPATLYHSLYLSALRTEFTRLSL